MEMAYGRVSVKDQNSERQLIKFRELGIDEHYVIVDKLSGKDFNRSLYQAMQRRPPILFDRQPFPDVY